MDTPPSHAKNTKKFTDSHNNYYCSNIFLEKNEIYKVSHAGGCLRSMIVDILQLMMYI